MNRAINSLIDDMKAALLKVVRDEYMQGVEDGKSGDIAFDDGFACDAGELIDGALSYLRTKVGKSGSGGKREDILSWIKRMQQILLEGGEDDNETIVGHQRSDGDKHGIVVDCKFIKKPLYCINNVGQCWECENNCGYKFIGVYQQFVPECRIEDKYMTYVNEPICRKYKKKKKNERIVMFTSRANNGLEAYDIW